MYDHYVKCKTIFFFLVKMITAFGRIKNVKITSVFYSTQNPSTNPISIHSTKMSFVKSDKNKNKEAEDKL